MRYVGYEFAAQLLDDMLSAMAESRLHKREVGFPLCVQRGIVFPGPKCKGLEDEIVVSNCSEGRELGTFHTHPKSRIKSLSGRRAAQNVPTVADVVGLLHDYLHRGSRLMCIGNPSWGKVTCYALTSNMHDSGIVYLTQPDTQR